MTKPFLKWPGGKRWLIPLINEKIDINNYNRYYEPFLGGGSIFFSICPPNAVLSDINKDLITTYKEVKKNPQRLIDELKKIPVSKKRYLSIRKSTPRDSFGQALRFLYLNRTAFAGLYRLNEKGEFNVPYGGGQRTPKALWNNNLLINASKALKKAKLKKADFETVLKEAGKGDLVYCDPTYTSAHNNNGFIRYNERNFSWKDQIRLAKICFDVAERGANVVVSNAFHPEIFKLYKNAQHMVLMRKSLLCPTAVKRKDVKEYLFIL